MRKIILLLVALINLNSLVNAQWQPSNGPMGGGGINSFASAGSKIFAGTLNGVYLSVDNGDSWKLM